MATLFDRAKGLASRAGKAAGELVQAGRLGYAAVTAPPQPAPSAPPPVNSDADAIQKASIVGRRVPEPTPIEPDGYSYDPMNAIGRITPEAVAFDQQLPSGLPLELIRRMARLPVPATVINIAIHELAEMCHPQKNEQGLGLRVRPIDDSRPPTRAQERRIREIEKVLFRGGGKFQSGGLDGWCRRVMRDSLTYDAAASQVLFTRGGLPYGLFALDARTIRRAPPTDEQIRTGRWGDAGYVQIVRNREERRWSPEAFMYGVRRPRTEWDAFNYGFSELEEIAGVIRALTLAENFNTLAFTSGVQSSQIIAILSDMDEESFDAYKRDIDANLSAASAKRRTPIIQLSAADREQLQAVNLTMSNREMEFQAWLHYLMKFVWAAYGMDPVLGNFMFGNEGQTNSLATASHQERITAAHVRGSRPRARALARWLTEAIVWKFDPELMAEFGGYDVEDEAENINNAVKQLSNFMTLNEIRARFDLPEDPDEELGRLVLNPYYFQAWAQKNGLKAMIGDQDPSKETDTELMSGLFQDTSSGGTLPEIQASLYARAKEAARRGLLKPPAGLGRDGRWTIIPSANGRPPVTVRVAA